MVDLELLQSVSYMAGALGVCVAAIYYVLNLRISQKNQEISLKNQELSLKTQELALKSQEQTLETRQAQLFMQLYSIYDSKEFLRDYTNTCWVYDYTDFNDWIKKYHPQVNPEAYSCFMRLGRFFEGVGILVEKKLISMDLVVELMREAILFSWEREKVYAYGMRELTKIPHIWGHFETLAEEVRARQPGALSADRLLDKTREMANIA
jgi:hypothetical protein